MRHSVKFVVLTAVAILMAMPALAADNGFYIGGSVGQADIATGQISDTVVVGVDLGAYKLFAGARFLNFLGAEGAYADFGNVEDKDISDAGAEIDGISLAAVAYLPFGIGDIFGKAGVFVWNADINTHWGRFEDECNDPM